MFIILCHSHHAFTCICLSCVSPPLQSNLAAVSRGVSQPDRASDEAADLFSEEAARTPAKSNGVHSDDESDLFAGEPASSRPHARCCPVCLQKIQSCDMRILLAVVVRVHGLIYLNVHSFLIFNSSVPVGQSRGLLVQECSAAVSGAQ